MESIAYLVLASLLVVLLLFTKADGKRYNAFKKLTNTKDRQRTFCRWLVESFLIFGGLSVIGLAVVGRLPAIVEFPSEFENVLPENFLAFSQEAPATTDIGMEDIAGAEGGENDKNGNSQSLPIMLAIGVLLGLVIRVFMARRSKPTTVGDVEPLLPRNGTERLWAALLSLNAGLSEELFFRLLLPVLFYIVSGNAVFSLAVSAVIFGLVHLYQGWSGVIATTFLGFVLTVFYLVSQSIWVPVAFHAFIDLANLVFVPWIQGPAQSRAANSSNS